MFLYPNNERLILYKVGSLQLEKFESGYTTRNLGNSSDTFSSNISNSSGNRKNARGVAAIAYVPAKGVAAIAYVAAKGVTAITQISSSDTTMQMHTSACYI